MVAVEGVSTSWIVVELSLQDHKINGTLKWENDHHTPFNFMSEMGVGWMELNDEEMQYIGTW